MLDWVYHTAERVDQLAGMDPEFQELARKRDQLDDAFSAFLDRLSEDDREFLLEYMDIVGEMQYRKTQLAWLYGKLHPHG